LFGRPDKKELLISVGIFVLALFVRLLYLYQSSANPSFGYPIVDSGNYDSLARSLAAGEAMSEQFFWQPFFYPFFLSIVYWAGNSSIICAKVIQVLLGCVTCLLTYHLGKRIFDRTAGIIAAVITALYGPLIFFEAELLASGWAAFWAVILILLFLESSSKRSLWFFGLLGICGALSIITRPTFVPFFTAAVVWLALIFYRSDDRWRKIYPKLGAILAGFLLIAIPVAAQNFLVTGHFGIFPSSGGINFYIGNNPNYTETMTARPGWGWDEILELPEQNGVTGDLWEKQKFFRQKVVNYVVTEPLGFLKGLAYKTIQFLNSREIPRNVDVYLFGKWSRLLGLLTWKAGRFGFPFGVLLPLALLGVVIHRRQIPAPVLLFVILYPLSIILVFTAARYRVPVIPVISVIAAAGLLDLIMTVRGLHWHRIAIISVFGVAIVSLSSLPGPFPGEKPNYEAELYYGVASSLKRRGWLDEAVINFYQALKLDPNYTEAHYNLGNTLATQGKFDEAISHYHQALQFEPNSPMVHGNLAHALAQQGKPEEAITHLKEVLRTEPDWPRPYYDLGRAYARLGKYDLAIQNYKEALRLEPDYAEAHYNLGVVYYRQGRFDLTIAHWTEAVKLKPDSPVLRRDLAWILEQTYTGEGPGR